MSNYAPLPRTYFVPNGNGVRVHVGGCSFHLGAGEIADFVDWLLADRPDPMPARRAAIAARKGKRGEEVVE